MTRVSTGKVITVSCGSMGVYCNILFSILCSFALTAIAQDDVFHSNLDEAKELSESSPDKAIPILLKLRDRAEAENEMESLAEVNSILGNCHYYLNDDSTAIKHWKRALDLGLTANNERFVAGVYNNLANGYSYTNPDSAIFYYKMSISLYNELGLIHENATQYLNLSYSFSDELLEYDSALYYVLKARKIAFAENDSFNIAGSLSQIGSIHLEQGQVDSSLYYTLKSLPLARSIDAVRVEYSVLDLIRRAYYDKEDYLTAFHYYDTLLMVDRQLNVEERLAEVQQIEADHEIALREAEIENLAQQKARVDRENTRQRVVIVSSILGLIMLMFLGFSTIKEKKRSDELLLNILPISVAEELKKTGKATAQRYESVTVLFTDFVDFSKVSEQVSAEVLVQMIDEYFSAFDKIISTYGLEKVKTIGDSYMAAGGIPEPTAEHASQVVQAALEMQQHVAALKRRKSKEGKPYFDTRIGVHTGSVVAGVVGIKKFAYDIWGDTVNIAARLEKASEAGKVNISEKTYDLVKDRFNCTHRGKIPIKNLGEIDMYFVG